MKKIKKQRRRFLRILGAAILVCVLLWLAMNLFGYSQGQEPSLFRKVPIPKKLEEVLGTIKNSAPEPGKEEPKETAAPTPEILSLSQIKEDAQEKVVESSKEIVREKVVEILKELINKLTEGEETKEKVCKQVCQDVCQEVCE